MPFPQWPRRQRPRQAAADFVRVWRPSIHPRAAANFQLYTELLGGLGERHDLNRSRLGTLLDERRELRAFIRHEHRDQLGRLAIAGIGGDQMRRAGRLEERLADLE